MPMLGPCTNATQSLHSFLDFLQHKIHTHTHTHTHTGRLAALRAVKLAFLLVRPEEVSGGEEDEAVE